MNIVLINGSPRKGGNTALLAKEFTDGAREAGKSVSVINAADMHIAPCMGCNACMSGAHNCVQKDDMQKCYELLADADVIVFATPIYFYSVSAQLKCLIDRLHNPIRNTFRVKKLALLAVCADTLPTVFDAVKTMYQSCLDYFKLEDGGIVTVFGVKDKGDILGNEALLKAHKAGADI